ncbi:hypothetical protein [Algoriphagus sanaruensis]|uniref:PglD N-terminal domain-containing protein n=1 Tax=Algoriphagus sanaruensis TaxID=1727163 RepID=A0A142ENB4_9BACT|nr:hypothetical protein [Algoriphagus sanaruensis]AMQ56619.1 hypothetical protein AO498_09325 [Algoriphagus sanaruensis]
MDLVIIGAGKLGEHLVENFSQFNLRYNLLGFVDDNPKLKGKKVAGLPVLGGIDKYLQDKSMAVVVALTSISEKMDCVNRLSSNPRLNFPNLISSGSWISRDCIVGKGNILLNGSLFNFGTTIGNFNSFGQKCSIGHEAVIRDFCFLDEEVSIGGFSFVEDGCKFGKGVQLKQGIRIGKESVIGPLLEIKEDIKPDSHL